jgi:hypothetical protein
VCFFVEAGRGEPTTRSDTCTQEPTISRNNLHQKCHDNSPGRKREKMPLLILFLSNQELRKIGDYGDNSKTQPNFRITLNPHQGGISGILKGNFKA